MGSTIEEIWESFVVIYESTTSKQVTKYYDVIGSGIKQITKPLSVIYMYGPTVRFSLLLEVGVVGYLGPSENLMRPYATG